MSEMIKVRYLGDKVQKLEYIGGKSDWIDLRAAENAELKQGEFKLIPLGVAMQLPAGYEAHMIPRSFTYKNFGVIQANHMGMFDESYCGNNDHKVFRDKGYSGKNTERPDFQEMMAGVRAGGVSRIIVYRLDRISRSVLDFANVISELQKYGVEQSPSDLIHRPQSARLC